MSYQANHIAVIFSWTRPVSWSEDIPCIQLSKHSLRTSVLDVGLVTSTPAVKGSPASRSLRLLCGILCLPKVLSRSGHKLLFEKQEKFQKVRGAVHLPTFHVYQCSTCKQSVKVSSPGTEVTESWEPPCGFWELNLGPLESSQCLTAEPSLAPVPPPLPQEDSRLH